MMSLHSLYQTEAKGDNFYTVSRLRLKTSSLPNHSCAQTVRGINRRMLFIVNLFQLPAVSLSCFWLIPPLFSLLYLNLPLPFSVPSRDELLLPVTRNIGNNFVTGCRFQINYENISSSTINIAYNMHTCRNDETALVTILDLSLLHHRLSIPDFHFLNVIVFSRTFKDQNE